MLKFTVREREWNGDKERDILSHPGNILESSWVILKMLVPILALPSENVRLNISHTFQKDGYNFSHNVSQPS